MNLIACGINHNTAPVELRERLAVEPEKQKAFLAAMLDELECDEAVFLNTCNRCEVYTFTNSHQTLIDWLCKKHGITENDFRQHVYVHQGANAISHAMKVASGMDSMVFGEPQIFGQVKNAVATSQEIGALGTQLHTVFQQVFSAVKKIRTNTSIGNEVLSVASVAVNLAKLIYEDFSKLNVLVIGAGDTIQQVTKQLDILGVCNISAANRNLEKAIELVKPYDGTAYNLEDLHKLLEQADIVISATASQQYIVKYADVKNALKKKLTRPKYFIDLAVPRDIEPNIASLEDIYLYNIDDLQKIINDNLTKRKSASLEAEKIINSELTHCMHKLRSRQHNFLIHKYRENAYKIKDIEVDKALKLLRIGHDAEEVMHKLALSITNKLLHEPTVQLKEFIEKSKK